MTVDLPAVPVDRALRRPIVATFQHHSVIALEFIASLIERLSARST
jgi:hypothetical protein